MWKNIVERGRPEMKIWRTHTACCIPKDTNTGPEYVILIIVTLEQWLHEQASVLRYITCLLHPQLRFPLCEFITHTRPVLLGP